MKPMPKFNTGAAITGLFAAAATGNFIWFALQPRWETDAQNPVCSMFAASWSPGAFVLAVAAIFFAVGGLLLKRGFGPHWAWPVGLFGIAMLSVGFVNYGHSRAGELCRLQNTTLQIAAGKTAPNASPAEKTAAANRADLVQAAARGDLSPAAGQAVLQKQHERAPEALAGLAKAMHEAAAKGNDPYAGAAAGLVPTTLPSPAPSSSVDPSTPAPVDTTAPPASPPTAGTSNDGPSQPGPSSPHKGGAELPPEVAAAMFGACLAAGVSAPVCVLAASILGDFFKSHGKDMTVGDMIRVANDVIREVSPDAQGLPPADFPGASDAGSELKNLGQKALDGVLRDPRIAPHLPIVRDIVAATKRIQVIIARLKDPNQLPPALDGSARRDVAMPICLAAGGDGPLCDCVIKALSADPVSNCVALLATGQ
jgi:hypothetical protein